MNREAFIVKKYLFCKAFPDKSHKIPNTTLLPLTYNFKYIGMSVLTNIKKDFTQNIVGYSSLGIVLSTCLGAFAILETLSFGNGLLPMLFVLLSVTVCSAHNAAILTVQKPILIYRLLVISTLANSAIIIGSLLLKI